jgi:hypothetical protein
MDLLGELLIEFNGAMGQVADGLRELGLSPTTRLKTSGTIIDKMKRQTHLNLGNIRDLAGARVVQRMSLDEQDAIADKIRGLWPDAQLFDRRANPSHGYRAIHLVPRIGGLSGRDPASNALSRHLGPGDGICGRLLGSGYALRRRAG